MEHFTHPLFHEWAENSVASLASEWTSSMLSNVDPDATKFTALMYSDGWFSVDGESWFGEFPSKAEAEAHLNIAFTKVTDL